MLAKGGATPPIPTFFMKIALDLDGTTFGSITAWLEQYHPQYTRDDMYKYNIWDIVENCTEEQFFDEFDKLDPRMIKLIDGARESILRIAEKHDVFFLTSKSERAQKWSEIVLKREGLDHIFVINNWTDGKKKNEYKYDLLLDDSPHNVWKKTVIFDAPWNRCRIDDMLHDRVFSWKGFEHYIEY